MSAIDKWRPDHKTNGYTSLLTETKGQKKFSYPFITAGITLSLILFWVSFTAHNTAFKSSSYSAPSRRNSYILSAEEVNSSNFASYLRPISLENASAVFNLVNGAVANKDQNVFPNGVAFLPAYIPEGVILYHGNNYGEIPAGVGWTAMDYEFSYSFMGHFGKGNSKSGSKGGKHNDSAENGSVHDHGDNADSDEGKGNVAQTKKPGEVTVRGIVPGGSHKPPARDHVTMLSFEVIKPLNKLIFLDGASGAKGSGGPLDTQMILGKIPVGETRNEYDFAADVCEWGKPWGIDGIIRIEVGFEVIICNMHSEKLRLSSNTTMDWHEHLLGLPESVEQGDFDGSHKNEIDSVLRQLGKVAGYDQMKMGNVHDHRDRRILVDFKGLTTPLNRTWIDADQFVRRVVNISQDLKDELLKDLEDYMSSDSHADPFTGTDWQLVANEIVAKFSPVVQLLNQYLEPLNKSTSDADYMRVVNNITALTGNFVRRYNEFGLDGNKEKQVLEAKQKAVYEYSHFHSGIFSEQEFLIWSSVAKVAERLVDMMFDFYGISRGMILQYYVNGLPLEELKDDLVNLKSEFRDLFSLLDWSTFYDCDHRCGLDSVCFTPFKINLLGGKNGVQRLEKTLHCRSFFQG